jgi:hypothetical protein
MGMAGFNQGKTGALQDAAVAGTQKIQTSSMKQLGVAGYLYSFD